MENVQIKEEGNYILISINPKIYPLEVVYAVAYSFTDKFYVLLDGDPESELVVELRPKNKSCDFKQVSLEFHNQLVTYANYAIQSEKNRRFRELLLQKVLYHDFHSGDSANTRLSNNLKKDYLDIEAKPWKN